MARGLWLIALAALGLRLAWGLSRPADPAQLERLPDQVEYLQLAQNLLAGQGLHLYDERFGDDLKAYRTPGYPLFIAALAAKPQAVRAAQSVLDALTVLAVGWLASQWLGSRGGVWAAALAALNPFSIYFSSLILSESLYTALLMWGILLLWRPRWWILGTWLLCLSALVRPGALWLALLLGLAMALNRPSNQTYPLKAKRWPLAAGATTLLLLGLTLLPWAIRNRLVLGAWLWTASNSGITAYDGMNPDADGASNQDFLKAMPQVRGPGMELQRDAYFMRLARQYAAEHPARAARLAAIKMARTWSPLPTSAAFATRRNMAIALAWSIPFFALVALGLGRGRLPAGLKAVLLLPALYFTLASALTVGSLRYRLPAEAPMAVLAAAGLLAISGAKTNP